MRKLYTITLVLIFCKVVFPQKGETLDYEIVEKRIYFGKENEFIPLTLQVHSFSDWIDKERHIYKSHKKIEKKYYLLNSASEKLVHYKPLKYDTTAIDTVYNYFKNSSLCSNNIKKELIYSYFFNFLKIKNLNQINTKTIRVVYPETDERKTLNFVTFKEYNKDSVVVNYISVKSINLLEYKIIKNNSFLLTDKYKKWYYNLTKELNNNKCLDCENTDLENTEFIFETNINKYQINFICEYCCVKNNEPKEVKKIRKKYRKFLNFIKNFHG
jgi:hypothetical protein